ncbi:MAG TPA: manganese efflux pump MntP family protein [Campylobacterales bacterium]|nr:manganese efflux pump MntP family protein [Campylobacterales bacterium]
MNLEILLIAVGLAMDAAAVSMAIGARHKNIGRTAILKPSAMFGFFQGLMPLIGFVVALSFAGIVETYDHYISFVILAALGLKMIYEGFGEDNEEKEVGLGLRLLTVLAIATSIDALAVGVTLAFLNQNIFLSALIIAAVTFVISAFSVVIGHKIGEKLESKAEIFGGIVLVLIGSKILLEHLRFI